MRERRAGTPRLQNVHAAARRVTRRAGVGRATTFCVIDADELRLGSVGYGGRGRSLFARMAAIAAYERDASHVSARLIGKQAVVGRRLSQGAKRVTSSSASFSLPAVVTSASLSSPLSFSASSSPSFGMSAKDEGCTPPRQPGELAVQAFYVFYETAPLVKRPKQSLTRAHDSNPYPRLEITRLLVTLRIVYCPTVGPTANPSFSADDSHALLALPPRREHET